MYNFTTELIKNPSNNMCIEEIFRAEHEKAFNHRLEIEVVIINARSKLSMANSILKKL